MSSLPSRIRDVVLQLEAGLREFYGNRYRGLILFGSYARGTAWEGSDVDLLLLLDGPVNPAREIMREPVSCPISLDSGVVLSVIPMSFETYQQGDSVFLDSVRQDAIPVPM
jgi:predicted nucleotidyltransferase